MNTFQKEAWTEWCKWIPKNTVEPFIYKAKHCLANKVYFNRCGDYCWRPIADKAAAAVFFGNKEMLDSITKRGLEKQELPQNYYSKVVDESPKKRELKKESKAMVNSEKASSRQQTSDLLGDLPEREAPLTQMVERP
jgi:hypothetical protein